MKKILFMVPCFSQGGVEHSLITAIKNLPTELFDITVFIRTNETKLISELPSSVHVIVNKQGHFYRHPHALLMLVFLKIGHLFGSAIEDYCQARLNSYIHRKKVEYPVKTVLKNKSYDVVVSYTVDDCTEMASLIPAKKRYVFYHTPYVDYKHDMIEHEMPQYDGMVACGSGVYNELKKFYTEKNYNIELLSNYVDIKEIMNKANEELAVEYRTIIDNRLIICTCGRIAPQKRYDLAIEAAKVLVEKGIDFVWILVGGGEKQEEYEKMIENMELDKRVYITGNQSNPYPFINCCDIYVQTSEFEAQPLTIIEAMKLGKPIVSTETLGGKTILEDGKKGILTPISAKGIADGILKYVNEPSLYLKMRNQYSEKLDDVEKQEYIRKWIDLLNR